MSLKQTCIIVTIPPDSRLARLLKRAPTIPVLLAVMGPKGKWYRVVAEESEAVELPDKGQVIVALEHAADTRRESSDGYGWPGTRPSRSKRKRD